MNLLTLAALIVCLLTLAEAHLHDTLIRHQEVQRPNFDLVCDVLDVLRDKTQVLYISDDFNLFDDSIILYLNDCRGKYLTWDLKMLKSHASQLTSNTVVMLPDVKLLHLTRRYIPDAPIFFFSSREIQRNDVFEIMLAYFNIYYLCELRDNRKETVEKEYVRKYLVYEVCAYCNEGNNRVSLVNSWTKGIGFRKAFDMKGSFKNNFFGRKLKQIIGSTRLPPLFMVYTSTDGNVTDVSGIYFDIFQMAQKYLNFTGEVFVSDQKLVGRMVNGSWTGLLGDLDKEKGDFLMPVGFYRDGIYEHFLPAGFIRDNLIFISAKPALTPPWQSVVAVFDWATWLMIVISFLFVGFILYMMNSLKTDRKTKSPNSTFSKSFFDAFKIIAWDEWTFYSPSLPRFLLMGTWMLASLIIVTAFTGALLSTIMKPTYKEKPIDSIEDLVRNNRRWLAFPGSNFAVFYLDHKQMSHLRMDERGNVGMLPSFQNLDNSNVILASSLIGEGILNRYFVNENGILKYHISKNSYFLLPVSWMLNEKSPFGKALTRYMLQLMESGLYDKILADNMEKIKLRGVQMAKKTTEVTNKGNSQPITLEHVSIGYIILLIGAVMGSVVLVGEILFAKIIK